MYWIKINLFKVLSTLDDTVITVLLLSLDCVFKRIFFCVFEIVFVVCCVRVHLGGAIHL